MNWENLSADCFEAAVKECGGVCLVPIGCLEKHGYHLPLGTDISIAREIAMRAAKIEEMMIFPYYPFGMVSEVRHKSGTVALSPNLQMQILEELCEELSRNGFKKIILGNGHGGNNLYLRFFAQTTLQKRVDYEVYVLDLWELSWEQLDHLNSKYGAPTESGHADVYETSNIMAISPELVDMTKVDIAESKGMHRMDELNSHRAFSAISWYGDYPQQFAGDPTGASAEYGNEIMDFNAENVAAAVKVIKESNLVGKLFKEFYDYSDNPVK